MHAFGYYNYNKQTINSQKMYASFQKSLCITLLIISLFINLCISTELCNPHDKKSLIQIKQQFGNPALLSLWDANTDCCSWESDVGQRVVCNQHGRVTRILINGIEDVNGALDFSGEFPSAFGDLTFLESIIIFNLPRVSGCIPCSFAKLTNLSALVIGSTNLSCQIPDFLGRLSNLAQLELNFDNLTGPIPNTLGRLTKLQTLVLNGNKLSGPIPNIFAKMPSLVSLYLSYNNLTGPIPDSLGLLPNLSQLYLEHNQLSGPIPESLGLLTNLNNIVMSNNQLTGPIPKSLGQISANQMDLSFNKISGDASFLFSNNTAIGLGISFIHLNNNFLKFDFSNVDMRMDINGFNISHNMIYGSLPTQLGELTSLYEIDVSYNCLCGPIPIGLQQFSPIFFDHNKCLCGSPLPVCK